MIPAWLSEIHCVFWDLDGTLYPNSPSLKEKIRELLYDFVAKHLQMPREQAIQEYETVLNRLKSNTMTLEYFGLQGEQTFFNVWDHITLSEYLRPDPELNMLFHETTHLHHGILSNSNSLATVEEKLRCVGLDSTLFQPIHTSFTVGAIKPDPAAFMAIIESVPHEKEHILYVGDRVDVDIVGAQKVGLRACLVYGMSEQADLSVDRPHDLLTMFKDSP